MTVATLQPVTPGKTRLPLIDIAKGLGILLIVLWHNHAFKTQYPLAGENLTAFLVPFFFFVSGVTFSPHGKTLGQIALTTADAWLKPALVATVGAGLLWLATGMASAQSILLAVTYATGFTLFWPAIWFLPHLWLVTLFSASVLMWAQRLLGNVSRQAILLLALAVSGYFALLPFAAPRGSGRCEFQSTFSLALFDCGLPLSADLLLITAFFFLSGYFLSAWVKTFRLTLPGVVAAGLAAATLGLLTHVATEHTDLNLRVWGNVLTSPIQAFCGIYLMLCVCDVLSRFKATTALFVKVGQMSLFILIFHLPVVFILIRNLPRYVHSPLLVCALSFLIPVLWSALLYEGCRRNRWLSALMLPRKGPLRLPAPQPSTRTT